MVKKTRVARTGKSVASLAAVLLVASACGEALPGADTTDPGVAPLAAVETSPPTTLVFSNEGNALGWLRSTTEHLSATGGSYIVGVLDIDASAVEAPDASGAYFATFPISVTQVLWAADSTAEAVAREASNVRVRLSDDREAWLLSYLEEDPRVIAVYEPQSEFSAIVSPVSERVPDDRQEWGTFDLSWVARDLLTTPLTVIDSCTSPAEFAPATEAEALAAHVAAVYAKVNGDATRANYERLADQLASDHAVVDEITGISVEPDVNDIVLQLENGTPSDEIEFQPVVPIVFDMRQYFGDPRVGVIVSTAGEYLGYMGIGPVDEPFVGEVRMPRDGGDIRIDLALSPPDECGVLPETLAELIVIPIDLATGDTRALADISDGSVTALTAQEYTALAGE